MITRSIALAIALSAVAATPAAAAGGTVPINGMSPVQMRINMSPAFTPAGTNTFRAVQENCTITISATTRTIRHPVKRRMTLERVMAPVATAERAQMFVPRDRVGKRQFTILGKGLSFLGPDSQPAFDGSSYSWSRSANLGWALSRKSKPKISYFALARVQVTAVGADCGRPEYVKLPRDAFTAATRATMLQ